MHKLKDLPVGPHQTMGGQNYYCDGLKTFIMNAFNCFMVMKTKLATTSFNFAMAGLY